jgi:hypothetical protein
MSTARVIIASLATALLVPLSLFAWASDPDGTQRVARNIGLCGAIGFFVVAYVNYFARLATGDTRPHFRVRDLLLLTSAIAILTAIGYAIDAVLLPLMIVYAYMFSPICLRLLKLWRSSPYGQKNLIMSVSTCVLGSYALLASILSLLAVFALPHKPKFVSGVIVPLTLLWPSAAIGWSVLGDNATSGTQLLLRGLPFGLPISIILWGALGALLGRVAAYFGYSTSARLPP